MDRVLYLGIDPPDDSSYVHYPVITTKRIPSKQLDRAIQHLDSFSHLIFTSKNGVRYWNEAASFKGKQLIAIGSATAEVIHNLGFECLIAKTPTQEGVIALLDTIEDPESCFLYLRSQKARDPLKKYIRQRRGSTVDLYNTFYQKLLPVPSLDDFTAVFFTSPSTVDGFFRIYDKIPEHLKIITIGPITEERIQQEISFPYSHLNLNF